jgi:glycine/D-amino acid oxidase-like deaminating enzyme
MKKYDFIILGAGIMGITTAIALRKQKYSVAVLNPDNIPHPLAASTDISKIVRMEYGTDEEYMDMVTDCFPIWREWNDFFNDTLFHETGFLLLSKTPMADDNNTFENANYHNLLKRGYTPERFDKTAWAKRFPAFNIETYTDGFYHKIGGYAESGRVVEMLTAYARQLGVDVFEGQTGDTLHIENGHITGVSTREGGKYQAGHVIVCAGNFTPYLVPDLKPYMKITGHPVFHLKPSNPEIFKYPQLAVFAADISRTGWYGFPLHPRHNVVKIANHGKGVELHPEHDERVVYEEDIQNLRTFLKNHIPSVAEAPIVYTRRCCYTDTLDGHFWIDNHPEIKGLTIGSGGSGHAFKMGPIIGDMIAAVALGGSHKWSARYRWRHLTEGVKTMEEARNS